MDPILSPRATCRPLIMNKGRQVARGDLHALKLLSEGVYEVAITFERLPETIEAEIARLAPLRMKINQNTVELTLKAEEARVLELVSEWPATAAWCASKSAVPASKIFLSNARRRS